MKNLQTKHVFLFCLSLFFPWLVFAQRSEVRPTIKLIGYIDGLQAAWSVSLRKGNYWKNAAAQLPRFGRLNGTTAE